MFRRYKEIARRVTLLTCQKHVPGVASGGSKAEGRLLLILWRQSFAIKGPRRREMIRDYYVAGKVEEFLY
jgi:hypothetical protein